MGYLALLLPVLIIDVKMSGNYCRIITVSVEVCVHVLRDFKEIKIVNYIRIFLFLKANYSNYCLITKASIITHYLDCALYN